MTDVTIRPFAPTDYAGLADIINLTTPHFTTTAERQHHQDTASPSHCALARWVAEHDNRLIGFSFYRQYAEMYVPDEYNAGLRVHPDFWGQGIGTRLYDVMLGGVLPRQPRLLRNGLREDNERGLAFAYHRGFAEVARRWDAILDVTTFDPSPYAAHLAQVAAQGIEIVTYADLADDPRRAEKLYTLFAGVEEDIPSPYPYTRLTFEEWRPDYVDNPSFLPEAQFIAVDNTTGEFAAACVLIRSDRELLFVELTGTARAYRRRGLALAVKVPGIEWARANGYRRILVSNDPDNVGMYTINDRLGFVRQPATLIVQKLFA